jgi:hypothetical protein
MNDPIAVEARFEPDGSIQPGALVWHGHRIDVQSVGRQWDEDDGRHILVLSAGKQAELVYRPADAAWNLRRSPLDFGSPTAKA